VAVTWFVAFATVLFCGASWAVCDVAGFALGLAAILVAAVLTSGRAVARGCRLVTGVGVEATVGASCAGCSLRCGLAATFGVTSVVGSLVARAISGLVVVRFVADVLAGVTSAGEVRCVGDGASAVATCARGVTVGWAIWRFNVGVAEAFACGV
jgi:hypothetical protein